MAKRDLLPLEQAIAEKTDRRAKYEKSMRDAGFCKTSLWVPCADLECLRLVNKMLGATNGNFRKALNDLLNSDFAE